MAGFCCLAVAFLAGQISGLNIGLKNLDRNIDSVFNRVDLAQENLMLQDHLRALRESNKRAYAEILFLQVQIRALEQTLHPFVGATQLPPATLIKWNCREIKERQLVRVNAYGLWLVMRMLDPNEFFFPHALDAMDSAIFMRQEGSKGYFFLTETGRSFSAEMACIRPEQSAVYCKSPWN